MNDDRPIYLPLARALQDDAPDTAALIRLAGRFGQDALAQYRTEQPEAFQKLAQCFSGGTAHFDLTIRDLTGMGPCIELIAVLADREVVLASQVLKRREGAGHG